MTSKKIYIEWLCGAHFALTSHPLYVCYADIRQPLNNMINQIWHVRSKLSEKNDCIMWYDTMIKRREQIADSQSIVIAFYLILSWVVVEFLARARRRIELMCIRSNDTYSHTRTRSTYTHIPSTHIHTSLVLFSIKKPHN